MSGLVELRKRARREAEKSEHRLAARIWELSGDKAIAFKQIQQGLDDYDQALVQCVQSDNRAHYLLSLYRKVAAYNHWAGRLKRAVDILVEAEKLALDIGDRSARVDVLDDRGIILQNLGRTVEAKQLHKEALDLARSQRYLDGRSRSLNNLAELLRKANNAKEALPLYEESAKVSRLLKDTVGELVSDSNRALALEQLSKVGEAEDLLKRVRDRSRRGEFFEQHVNAISSLANIAWKKGEYRLAARRYSQAIQASTAHRLHENAVTAAVSYSRLETMLGDPEAGLKILEKLSINHPITALLTLKMEIAARLSEVKDVERYFGIAEDVAKLAVLVGNESLADKWLFELAYCECERAGLSANSSIKRVMSSAAREQLTLPGGEILMVLYQGSISQAERLLEKLSEDIGSASDRAELQFMIADYFWKRSARYRYRSLIHYYFALGGDGSKALIDAFSHILQRLASLYPEPGAKTVVYLERKVEGYFKRANIDDSTMRKLMWPFSTVRELKRIPLNTRENAEAVNAIIHRHLLAAFA